MTKLFLLISALILVGCNKPDPHPELKDPIFLDLQSELQDTQKNLAEIKGKVEEHRAEMQKAKPQSGQIKFAEKRFWKMSNLADQLEQQEKYWKVRIEERRKHARIEYLKAYHAHKAWPDPKEFDEYVAGKRLRLVHPEWNVKKRLETYQKENGVSTTASPKAEGAAPAGH